jgi:hypothetical protein
MNEQPRNLITRRAFGRIALFTSAAIPLRGIAQDTAFSSDLDDILKQDSIIEGQYGDPLQAGEKFESIKVIPIQQKAVGDDPVEPKKNAGDLAERMLEISLGFARKDHVSRANTPAQVTEILNLCDFGLKLGSDYVPYCAAGVSYAACRAFCDIKKAEEYDDKYSNARTDKFKSKMTTVYKHYFFPSALVRVIKADAIKRKTWVDASVAPKRGWLIVFSWNGGTYGNHIGLVTKTAEKDDKVVETVEYNTTVGVGGSQGNGGAVAERTRKRDKTILGYVNFSA